MADDVVDVLIIGAGLSGIGAACHLKRQCPDRSFAIVEARQALGGTWDLFRYPGIRSDSDMYTLGYSFKPWIGEKAIADGPSILQYLQDTARENGIDQHIRYGHKVLAADWSSTDALWTVSLQHNGGQPTTLRCNFLWACSGYYNYDAGYTPAFEGLADFKGRVVHPQKWHSDISVKGQRVVVIGSGATAVTLVPELAKEAAHVTLLQRSPTYMVTRPSVDRIAQWLLRRVGPNLAHGITRWKNLLYGMWIFKMCRAKPMQVKARLLGLLKDQLPPGYDINTHFNPRYKPWDQRMCLVPDGDIFKAISTQRVQIVTDQIERFTATGMVLKGGQELPADTVVTATGLQLQTMAGMTMSVDGRALKASELVSYKGMMFGGVPNFASVMGYTNASWTLKADLVSDYVCRLLNHMQAHRLRQCTPAAPGADVPLKPWVDFSSGYFQRVIDQLPKQGAVKPYMLNQNYVKDLMWLRFGKLEDGVMRFQS